MVWRNDILKKTKDYKYQETGDRIKESGEYKCDNDNMLIVISLLLIMIIVYKKNNH